MNKPYLFLCTKQNHITCKDAVCVPIFLTESAIKNKMHYETVEVCTNAEMTYLNPNEVIHTCKLSKPMEVK